jgi:hypothetical protein
MSNIPLDRPAVGLQAHSPLMGNVPLDRPAVGLQAHSPLSE